MFLFFTSLWVWGMALVIGLLYFPVAVLIWVTTVFTDKRLRVLHLFSSFWASTHLWINPLWKVSIDGRKKIDPGKTYVMVCNHQSLLDILVLYRLFAHFKWVSKAELFKVPILGWNMVLNRYIAVNRASKKSHIEMMKQCEKTLKSGSSIMVFPEGTRSPDGKIHSFKEGAFKLAQLAECDILPIVLNGTSNSLPKSGFIMKKSSNITVKVLDPIPYETFAGLTTKELTEKIQHHMVSQFEMLTK